MMSQNEFECYCRDYVAEWYNTKIVKDESGKKAMSKDVFMTWFSKTSDKMKGLFGLSIVGDNHYFEFTYIDEDLIVMDVYDRVDKSELYPGIMQLIPKTESETTCTDNYNYITLSDD